MADWLAIKTEYLAGGVSFSQLAEKYGVNKSTISRRAKKEGWVKDAATICNDLQRATAKKIVAAVSDTASDTATIKARLDQKLWSLIEQAAGELTMGGPVDPADLRRVVQCYVDMRNVPEDMQSNMEQHDALIEALKEAAKHED